MKAKPDYEVGSTVVMPCSVCDCERDHFIRSLTKQKAITKADCSVCETSNTFRQGVKTSVSMSKSKSVAPYDRGRKYKKGQTMLHSVFGLGEVTSVLEMQKIDVLFGDQTKRLIHDRN